MIETQMIWCYATGFVIGLVMGSVVMGLMIKNNPKRFFRIFYKPNAMVNRIEQLVSDSKVDAIAAREEIKHLINIFRGGKSS